MLNQAAIEALYSATYVENYLDCIDNLPDQLQRHLSKLRELDVTHQGFFKEIEQYQESARKDSDQNTNRKILAKIQTVLIKAQEIGDEKLQIIQQIQDLIENKTRNLDVDFHNLDFAKDQENTEPNRDVHNNNSIGSFGSGGGNTGGERQSKRARRTRNDNLSSLEVSANLEILSTPEPIMTRGGSNAASANKKATTSSGVTASTGTGATSGTNTVSGGNTGKKKKRKSRQAAQHAAQQQQAVAAQQQRDDSPQRDDDPGLDPDEPTYCLCDQISYGEMILCDNDLCPIEWFHFQCVALATKPKGKWFCPKCRGDRPNVMKPKAQFLKELERYNKEKEEKS